MDTPPASHASDRLPGWLAEALDVLSARRRIVVATAVGLVLLGAIVALVAPSILPARAVVGAAVGIAAALLATALALAMDASDLVVRGVRHVRAAGGTVDVHVGRQHDDVGPLLAAVARHASDGQVRVALSPASRTAGVPGVRAAALAEALARTGRKVLLTDLARGGTPAAGLSDVISGSRSLPEVVRFEQELYLARLAVGSDPDAAIRGFAGWVEGLPSDLEVLVAALPPLADPGVLAAAGAMDATLVLVEVGRTERVDLIASLDAVDAAGLTSELVLVDPDRTPGEEGTEAPDDQDEDANAPSVGVDEEPEPVGEVAPEPLGHEELGAQAPDVPDVELEAEPAVEASATVGAFAVEEEWHPDEADVADDVPPEDDLAAEPATSDVDVADEPVQHLATELDAPPDADATAEIPALAPADDDLPPIWDPPTPSPTPTRASADVEAEAWPDPTSDQPEPTESDEPAPEPTPEPTESHEPAPVPPEPTPVADDEPEPEPAAPPAPQPVPAGTTSGSGPGELTTDPAAMEVARTSAALHQLAQQIWERDDR